MKDFLIKRYEAHQLENIRTIDSVAAEAKNEIDNYWAIWKTRNKKSFQLVMYKNNIQKNWVAMRQDLDILVMQRN